MKINPHIKLIVIDLFCGGGGTTTGFHRAKLNGKSCVAVVIGINHDAKAIASHKANHPETHHFTEDIRTVNILLLLPIIEEAKKQYPNAKVMVWMSAECTHHSIAKGGLSRDADSRSLPEYVYNYIEVLNPDIVGVENVKEFLNWGPLKIKIKKTKQCWLYCPLDIKRDKKTKKRIFLPTWIPDPEYKSLYYNQWCETIKNYGYSYDYQLLNAADYGAFTSRIRYFGYFAKEKQNIVFPTITHSKDGKDGLKKYKAVKEVLDFSEIGNSIFGRKKPLVDNTLKRVYEGLIKEVAGGKDNFMIKYNSMSRSGKYVAPGTDEPCPTVAVQQRLGVCFLSKAYSGHPESKNVSVEEPAGTITTVDHHQFIQVYYSPGYSKSVNSPSPTVRTKDGLSLISPQFLTAYYGNGFCRSIEEPSPTVTTKDRLALINTWSFMDMQYGNGFSSSVKSPAATVTTTPKHQLVQCTSWLLDTNFFNNGTSLDRPAPTITANRKWHYLVNPQYNSAGSSINKPCFTLIARMDKRPPSIVEAISQTENLPSFIRISENTIIYEIYETDSEIIMKIKEFMAMYGIVDILMRMLLINELKRIMGFPENYVLKGTKSDQKKFIGNAVECTQAQVNIEAICKTI